MKTMSGVAANTGNLKLDGFEQIQGFRTVRVIDDRQSAHATLWYSPDFGCQIIKQEVLFKGPNGIVVSKDEKLPTLLKLGDPDPDLFVVPSDRVEAGPTAAFLAYRKLYGPDSWTLVPDREKPRLNRLGEIYTRLKPKP